MMSFNKIYDVDCMRNYFTTLYMFVNQNNIKEKKIEAEEKVNINDIACG